MSLLPSRRTLVHKAVEPRNLSAKVAAQVAARTDDFYEVKYDGCHAIIIKHGGQCHAYSRQGEPVPAAVSHVLERLAGISEDNFVLFCEAWHPDLEHSVINGAFRRQYVADGAELLELVVFDAVPYADFLQGTCPVRFKTRRDWASIIVRQVMGQFDNHDGAPIRMSYAANSVAACVSYVDHCRAQGEVVAIDGFMRKDRNGLWKAGAGTGGESVKLKDHMSIDVKVLAVQEGKGKFTNKVGALTVLWGLRELTVGGGKLTDKERAYFWDFPQELVGKIVEVHGLSESANGMIREPRFIRIRHDKTEGE